MSDRGMEFDTENEKLVKHDEPSVLERYKNYIIIGGIALLVIVIIIILVVALSGGSKKDDPDDPVKPEFEFGLTMEELKKRTQEDYLTTFKLLTPESPEYVNLAEGDKEALKHLVKSGAILENIQMRIDNIHNIPVKEFLEKEIKKGNQQANLTKILFDAQKGINAIDALSQDIRLIKGFDIPPGKGFYPEDLKKEEFHQILTYMIKNGKIEEVKKILNQRSMVFRDNKILKSVDYVEYFKDDFAKMADELEEAAKTSTDANFTEYLRLQAAAFRTPNNTLDALADIQWATLQYTPLEYTITRENYDDELTTTITENQQLSNLLKEHNITAYNKDYLGCRVGIVNEEGTKTILAFKEVLPILADHMPFKEEYDYENTTEKQTMVDVDIAMLAGDVGAYRGGITLAENLPNDDKLSLTMGGGRRNVYHRQIRASDPAQTQKKLNAILDPEQHTYYKSEADHWFTVGHENLHSLGPSNPLHLGKYTSIIEENKADMGAIGFVDLLKNISFYNETQAKEIIVTAVVDLFLKSKPPLTEAHRVRSVMQNYYLHEHGAYNMTEDNKIHVNIENVCEAAYSMLEEIIRIQIDDKFEDAETYINKYFNWTDEMEIISKELQKVSNKLNGRLESKLADKLLSE